MNKLFCILASISISSLFLLNAGDFCDDSPEFYNECSSCGNTGYLFAYGGVSFGYDLDIALGRGGAAADFDTGYIVGAGAVSYTHLTLPTTPYV